MSRPVFSPIFRTKLEPPRLKDFILFRPTLSKKLKRISQHPLTLVYSGPGYGKSTSIASFLRQEQLPYCWYSISEQDTQLHTFFLYLVEAMRTRYTTFADAWLEEVLSKVNALQDQNIYLACSYFINECLLIEEEVFLVVDDYHLVSQNRDIETFMTWLLLHLPEQMHVIVLSRMKPTWDILPKFKVNGHILEISEPDFAFSEDEIAILFEDYYQTPLAPKDIQLIYRKTEGWIMAIQMIWQQLREEKELQYILGESTFSMNELFQYMAQEVLTKLPNTVKTFIVQSSILEIITEEACYNIFKQSNSSAILQLLQDKSLFLFSVGDKAYRYHALFREFLLQQLMQEEALYIELQTRAGRYFTKRQELEQALYHLKMTKNSEEIASFISDYGDVLIKQGSIESVLQQLLVLSRKHKDAHPKLWVYEGDIHRYRSQYEQALSCYHQAEAEAIKRGDKVGEGLGLEGKARIYLDTIQPKQAEHLLQKAIDSLENSTLGHTERLIQLYSLIAENSINSGRAKEAEHWYKKARNLQIDYQEQTLEARLHLRTGRLLTTLKLLEGNTGQEDLGIEITAKARITHSHREKELLLSFIYALLGEAEKSKRSAERAIFQGVRQKSPFVEACGWIRMGHAVQLFTNYDVKLSEQCYHTALEIMDEINISRGKAEAYLGLCLLYGKRKNTALAIQYGELGLIETEQVHDFWLSTLIRLAFAITYIHSENWQKGLNELTACQRDFEQCGDSYGLTITLLWQAYLAHLMDHTERFDQSIRQLVDCVEQDDFGFVFQRRTLFGPTDVQRFTPMLLEAFHKLGEHPILDQLLSQMGIEDRTSHPGYTLRIHTLGEFKVFLGEEVVREKDWKREKAKELLQLFITKRRQLLPKEEIYALLWRDQPEEVADRDFKVALNTLNKVLEPQRQARTVPFYIQRQANAYGLNPAAPFVIDTIEFETGVKKGLEVGEEHLALSYLERALKLYRGDYLLDKGHDDWCSDERERLQVLFLRGAEKLANLYLKQEHYDQAISWCEVILSIDKCWEEAYRMLMMCYQRKRNRSLAIRWYKRCQQVLFAELGVEPMLATTELFEVITKEG